MTWRDSHPSGRTSFWVSLLVAIIFLLPPLVRATGRPISAPDSFSSIRLNRGFDKPESKQTLTPPIANSSDRVSRAAPAIVPRICRPHVDPSDVLFAPQHSPSVDPQRGPPVRLIS
jgi:hypothetical protein